MNGYFWWAVAKTRARSRYVASAEVRHDEIMAER